MYFLLLKYTLTKLHSGAIIHQVALSSTSVYSQRKHKFIAVTFNV